MIEQVIVCPKRYQAHCDAPGCGRWCAEPFGKTVREASDLAKAAGWTRDGKGRCFCPLHTPAGASV